MTKPFWIVWNGNTNQRDFPTIIHQNKTDAKFEAERLALKERGYSFFLMEMVGEVRVKDIEWEYPERDESPF